MLFGHYIPPKNTNYQIEKRNKLLHRDNLGRKQKMRDKKSKRGQEISQGEKFCRGCEIRNCSMFSASAVMPSGSIALSSN